MIVHRSEHRYRVVSIEGDIFHLENQYGAEFSQPTSALLKAGYQLSLQEGEELPPCWPSSSAIVECQTQEPGGTSENIEVSTTPDDQGVSEHLSDGILSVPETDPADTQTDAHDKHLQSDDTAALLDDLFNF